MPNPFYVVRCIEKFTRHFCLKPTHHDIDYIYNCYKNPSLGYHIKFHRCRLWQILCLPDSSRNLQEEFLKATGNWYAKETLCWPP